MSCPAQMLGYLPPYPPSRSCSAGILPANFAFSRCGVKTPAGSRSYKGITLRCHSERSVPRFCFCAKRRDTQSRNLSWM